MSNKKPVWSITGKKQEYLTRESEEMKGLYLHFCRKCKMVKDNSKGATFTKKLTQKAMDVYVHLLDSDGKKACSEKAVLVAA
jgi:hypothetical protein